MKLCGQYFSVNTGRFVETNLCALETYKSDCFRRMMCQWKETTSVTLLKFHKVQQCFYRSQNNIQCILAIKKVVDSCSSDLYVSDTHKFGSKGPVLIEEYCPHNFIRLDDAIFTFKLSQYIISFFEIITQYCLSHSCDSNACKFVSNGAILIELFTIYYANGAHHQNQPFLE